MFNMCYFCICLVINIARKLKGKDAGASTAAFPCWRYGHGACNFPFFFLSFLLLVSRTRLSFLSVLFLRQTCSNLHAIMQFLFSCYFTRAWPLFLVRLSHDIKLTLNLTLTLFFFFLVARIITRLIANQIRGKNLKLLDCQY